MHAWKLSSDKQNWYLWKLTTANPKYFFADSQPSLAENLLHHHIIIFSLCRYATVVKHLVLPLSYTQNKCIIRWRERVHKNNCININELRFCSIFLVLLTTHTFIEGFLFTICCPRSLPNIGCKQNPQIICLSAILLIHYSIWKSQNSIWNDHGYC